MPTNLPPLPGPGLQRHPGDHDTWGTKHAHDPTVVRADDGTYYMFSTDAVANSEAIPAGVHIRRSADLVNWTYSGTALDGVPGPAAEWTGAAGLWAPEVVRWPDASWHMYYSASTFGSRTSAIGLATAREPAGPWLDRGLVLTTRQGESGQNAIDAAVTFDRAGRPWLTYGSFFDGIYCLPLDPQTGLAAEPGPGTLLARRPESVDGAVEGAFILYRPQEDRFVLFLSYDSLFSTYNVRTAVATDITGPYLDRNGNPLTETSADPQRTGTKILGSYAFDGGTAWLAPGHNSIFTDNSGSSDRSESSASSDGSGCSVAPDPEDLFMVHHVRRADDPSHHEAQLRRVYFTASGWPVVSPQPFAGLASERLPAPIDVDGVWQVVRLDPADSGMAGARDLPVRAASPAASDGTPVDLTLDVDGQVLEAVLFAGRDWAGNRDALCFSGLDAEGTAWFGTRGVSA
ncbi:arabinan endo-1,5-alpha-L-arabinosidase [Arthrobacter sp. NPDC097144]|uniref:arabinan endo-1,5-alpha-L-arabinosidase n=1 Tax=Arthrobacter sp. NPDC097144 TaxID=3363946 RepID=UPI003817B594